MNIILQSKLKDAENKNAVKDYANFSRGGRKWNNKSGRDAHPARRTVAYADKLS